MRRLNDKVALITGAARGIGEAIARGFAQEGAIVILSDINDATGRSAAARIGGAASYVRLDVREESDWRRALDAILTEHGRLETVALYCAAQGLSIRCNSVHPAAILTPMWDAMLGDGEEREQRAREFVRDTPLRRFGTVEEVAHAVIYLASDESGYTTGSEIVIDGGILAGSAAMPKQ